MKYLFRNLLIAAAPFILRELFRRLDDRGGSSRRRRPLLAGRSR
jgi:hypothetical protein